MTVYLKDNSEALAKSLKDMGYFVTRDINSDFDAYIYSDSMEDMLNTHCNNAVLIINSEGKSTAEIDNILQNRLYSPIFSL